jgi:hypothetical protein
MTVIKKNTKCCIRKAQNILEILPYRAVIIEKNISDKINEIQEY